MNYNHSRENLSGVAETMNLGEETTATSSDRTKRNIKNFFKVIRTRFSQNSQRSALSNLLETLYVKALSSKARSAAVFLMSFSIVALVISYALNASVGNFISDVDTFSSIVLLIVSLILFTTNKTFHSLIASSKILGMLSVVYNEQGITLSKHKAYSRENLYSTPFFLGVICGIFTVIYPVSVICTFIISLITILLIFNRPECGMLLIIAVLPVLSTPILLTFACVTFLSLLYRYLLGKRHIDFGVLSMIMLISIIYVLLRCIFSAASNSYGPIFIYIVFFISCFTAMNLIRSTAMFRRTVQVLIRMTRAFTLLLVAYYLSNLFFGRVAVEQFLIMLNIESFVNSLTSISFVAPFLAMAVPINFSFLICGGRSTETLSDIVYMVLLFASMIYVSSYSLILISILSVIAILFFYNKRYGFLVIASPLAAYALLSLFKSVPTAYKISALSYGKTDIQAAVDIIKTSPLFGQGPTVTDYSGNMLINIIITFGFVGLVLFFALLLFVTIKSIKSVSTDIMQTNTSRFLSIGLLCAILSFASVCIFTDFNCNLNTIFMFAAVISASVMSGKCYESDYIDNTVVREYKNK